MCVTDKEERERARPPSRWHTCDAAGRGNTKNLNSSVWKVLCQGDEELPLPLTECFSDSFRRPASDAWAAASREGEPLREVIAGAERERGIDLLCTIACLKKAYSIIAYLYNVQCTPPLNNGPFLTVQYGPDERMGFCGGGMGNFWHNCWPPQKNLIQRKQKCPPPHPQPPLSGEVLVSLYAGRRPDNTNIYLSPAAFNWFFWPLLSAKQQQRACEPWINRDALNGLKMRPHKSMATRRVSPFVIRNACFFFS